MYGSVNKLGTYHKLAKAYLSPIMEEYLAHNDEPGMFRMVNAVTAVAREVRNPALKWNLECMAGEMAMLRNMPMIEPKPYRAELPNEKEQRTGHQSNRCPLIGINRGCRENPAGRTYTLSGG
ncbi:MAG: hypothetical protein OSA95_07035 [Opitutales bacterium]|nr:hypothetical protein [Opitutales bacterium]